MRWDISWSSETPLTLLRWLVTIVCTFVWSVTWVLAVSTAWPMLLAVLL